MNPPKSPVFASAPAPQPAPPPLPALYVLRFVSGIHLLLAALLTPNSTLNQLLIRTSPLQIPLLLFVSGFTAVHSYAQAHLSRSFSPSQFYARRFARLLPLYLLVVLLHPLFSFSSDAFPRTFLSPLSPFLPSSLTFPQTDSPLLAQTFVPSLFLCYLLFPILLDLFPRFVTSHPIHLHYMLAIFYCTIPLQSYWLSHLPSTRESHHQLMLLDITFHIPFLSHIPSFALGMLVSLLRLSNAHKNPRSNPPTLPIRLARALVACLIFCFFIFLVLPWRLEPPASDGSQSFYANFLICGVLLLPFAPFVYACATLSDPYTVSSSPYPPYNQSRNESYAARSYMLGPSVWAHLSGYSYTVYVLAALVWRSLGLAACGSRSKNGADMIAFRRWICVISENKPSQAATTLSSWWWWPWSKGEIDESLTNAALAAAKRLSTSTRFEGIGVRTAVYLPVLLSVAWLVYWWVLRPIGLFIIGFRERLLGMAEDGMFMGYGSWAMRMLAFSSTEMGHRMPKRNNSNFERAVRVLIYYMGGLGFLWFVFRYSVPFGNRLADARPLGVWCWLPNTVFRCNDWREERGLAGTLGAFGIGSKALTNVVDALRWLSCLTLPTMLLNIVGHILYPRAIWQRLPTVPQMFRQGLKRDEENQVPGSDLSFSQEFPPAHGSLAADRSLPSPHGLDLDFLLFIRYVTRGNNPRLVQSNAKKAAEILEESGIPMGLWRVEVVTDKSIGLEKMTSNPYLCEIVVPESYSPPNGALFKARALNYAIEASSARSMDWIVHLDEETQFDADTIRAILYHCGTETYRTRVTKSQRWPRIGQGAILYGRSLTDESLASDDVNSGNWLTTLADSGRVSDDCGRYRIQYESGEVWVGMHGSFVVAANCIEQEVTFDHGVEGSIAEDAFFALLARGRGVRFAWIDALMYEQSPFTPMDFVKQRSRWLVGGLKVVNSRRIPFRLRVLMKTLTLLWTLMPLTYATLIFSVLFGSSDDDDSKLNQYFYRNLLPLLAAASLWNYVFGFFVTFSVRRLGIFRFLVLLYVQVILAPVFGVMEVMSVTYAVLNFSKLSVGFHVVEKDSGTGTDSAVDNKGTISVNETSRLL
eukprot:GFKZ01005642.1.p1 GENE.GFKZ01005642.1~~GFKZ01005642.1.p1  ORF type:complete len:1095 (+),score=96.39 GFKZ01005642.1:192-3476(+)